MHIITYQINTWEMQNCVTELQEPACLSALFFLFFSTTAREMEDWIRALELLMNLAPCFTYAAAGEGPESPMKSPF